MSTRRGSSAAREQLVKNRGGGGVKIISYTSLGRVYPTVPTSVLKEWDIGRIAHKDAVLFMWAIDAHMKDALELFQAWGLHYVIVAFVWTKKSLNGKTLSNLAPWTLKNCELCLMGTRGWMVQYKQKNNIPQLVEAVRTRHGEKPQEVRRRIEELLGDVERIELFVRRHVPGWDRWGNEIQYDNSNKERAEARLYPYAMDGCQVAGARALR